jgi:hypothetical protein
MKKSLLTIGIFALLITMLNAQTRLQRLHFTTLDGQELELFVTQEEDVYEPLFIDSAEVLKEEQQKDFIGFDGEKFDVESISNPEEEIEETIINTKAVFEQVQSEKKQASAK